ncbi:MAG: carboxypeptidase-like regulatory domain-containing protein, partial [Candidatus Micrarchaeota archaeon]|nr:carboxypeptidase-like regulatory domain-containing protein [Candidatus Micrarchaeota archaeon]
GNYRPIKGAAVTALYQSSIFYTSLPNADALDGKSTLYTNESGKVVHTIYNQVDSGQDELIKVNANDTYWKDKYELRSYYLRANYSGVVQTIRIDCNREGPKCHDNFPHLRMFQFDAYRIYIYARDQDGKPVEGARVVAAGQELTTDKDGIAWISSLNGRTYDINVSYAGMVRTGKVKVSGADANFTPLFYRYDVRLRVIDDTGAAVDSDVLLDGLLQHTDENGYVSFRGITKDSVEVLVRYANGFRKYTLPLSNNVDMDVVVDKTAPVIRGVSEKADGRQNLVVVTAVITDPGEHASGLSPSEPARLRYNIGGQGWSSVPMYPVALSTYQATIPLEYDKAISYEIEALDAQNNAASYTNTIGFKKGESQAKNETSGEPAGEEAEVPSQPIERTHNIDMMAIIAGIVIAGIVLLILYKKYTGEI